MRRQTELVDDDDGEEDEDDDEEEEEEGECSTSTGDQHNPTLNSEENDKLKNYPCTQCGKVLSTLFPRLIIFILSRYLLLNTI